MGLHVRGIAAATALCAVSFATLPLRADEIRLKDGKKLNGVIVGYEQNMFRVKTDFGYVLVEKDKIASIVPSAEAQPAPNPAADSAKPAPSNASPSAVGVSAKTAVPGAKTDKPATKVSAGLVKPSIPPNAASTEAVAPALKGGPVANAKLPAASNPAAPPPRTEPPAVREDIQGNVYVNHTNGFRMYKAPSWQLIDG